MQQDPSISPEQVRWTRGRLQSNEKQVIVAIDHGLSFPDMPGLERPQVLVRSLSDNARVSGLIASPGIYRQARRWGVDLTHMNRLITVDYLVQDGDKLVMREMFISPEEAADYQPDCYKMFFNVYQDKADFMRNVHDFSRFAAAGRRLGVSCLAEVLFYNNPLFHHDPKRQADLLYFGCRAAMELGADVLKIPLIEDTQAICEIIDRLGLPTFILGGAKADSASFVESMRALGHLPVCGVMLGRNIWQSADMNQTIASVADAINNV